MLWAAGYGWDSFLIGRHVTFGNPPVEHKLIMTSLSFILNQCLFSHMCLSLFLILEGTRKTSDEYMSYRSNALVLLLDTNPQNSSCKNKIIQLPWWWGNQILTGVSWFPVHQAREGASSWLTDITFWVGQNIPHQDHTQPLDHVSPLKAPSIRFVT